MASIRRTVGGFALAAAAAAVLVVVPAQAQVTSTSTTTTTTSSSICDTIRQTIRFITDTYDEPLESVLLAPWKTAAALYQCE